MVSEASERDGDPVVEVEFRISDAPYPFVSLSGEEGCQFELEKMLPREGEQYAEFFSVDGADPDRIERRVAAEHDVDCEVLARHETGGLFEFVVSHECPARTLAAEGSIPRTVTSEDGTGRLVAEIPSPYESSRVVADFLDTHPSATLVTKQERQYSTPLFTGTELERALDERLTDRQREVLRAAYESGYYERPRETTGEELADQLGINPATLTQHVRAAERSLLSLLYEKTSH